MTETASLVADLERAKALIDTPDKWGKGDGEYAAPAAPCLCIISACYERSNGANPFPLTRVLEESLIGAWYDRGGFDDGLRLARFNDAKSTTHADVMALFDRAIALAKTGATP